MLHRLLEKMEFTKGLGFRLGALLSVAILPIGMISLFQNLSLSDQAERSNEMVVLGHTALAAAGERALLQSALGTGDALGPTVLDMMDDPLACSELLRSFIERSATYAGAMFVDVEGMVRCDSRSSPLVMFDVSGTSVFKALQDRPATMVVSVPYGMVSQRPVVVVMQPVYRDGVLMGYVGVSLTQDLLQSTHAIYRYSEGARVVTFNAQGEILTADINPGEEIAAGLPADVALSDLTLRNESTFRGRSTTGESRVFAVAPVVPGLVYALGSWSPRTVGLGAFQTSRLQAYILPITLWLVSLAVAYFAVYRLVLRHIRELRGQMRRFAIGSRATPPPVLQDAPSEIADVSQTFHNMARILIRDEEAMEAAVAEKTVLLKEVHHRVKNNLQLIASIINMQSRVMQDPDARRVLRSVQDRVAALATIYRNLYQAEQLDAVQADRLIGDIINQMANAALGPGASVRIETDLAPLTLLPDQAVPLSLLATEAFTNALKYAGAPPGGPAPWVRVSLRTPQPGQAVLEVVNSLGPEGSRSDVEGTGLGSQLIEAFSTQLEGEPVTGIEDGTYVMRLPFAVDLYGDPGPMTDMSGVVLTSAARGGARH